MSDESVDVGVWVCVREKRDGGESAVNCERGAVAMLSLKGQGSHAVRSDNECAENG